MVKQTRKRKRNVYGLRKIKGGESPRTHYAKTYHAKPVYLLPNTKLFQVSFDDPKQFSMYKRITEKTKVECFIQTLFSLGLRKVNDAKADVEGMQTAKKGVHWSEAKKYIATSFGLELDNLDIKWLMKKDGSEATSFAPKLSAFLKLHLDDNHATIYMIMFKNYQNDRLLGHFTVAYKHNNVVKYFDPQKREEFTAPPKSLVTGYYPENFAYFDIKGVTEPKLLQVQSCPIPFVG